MPVLRPKDASVRFDVFGANAPILAAGVTVAMVLKRDLVITAGTDSHPAGDVHTRGDAVDFRASDLSEAQILAALDQFKAVLGAKFTSLYEVPTRPNGVLASVAYVNPSATGSHLHVQFRKGLTYTLDEAKKA